MYQFELYEQESILYNNDDVLLKKDSELINVSIVITNNRFLLFQDPKQSSTNSFLKTTRALGSVPMNELIFERKREEIKVEPEVDFIKVSLTDGRYLLVNDKNILNILN